MLSMRLNKRVVCLINISDFVFHLPDRKEFIIFLPHAVYKWRLVLTIFIFSLTRLRLPLNI